MKLLRIAVQSAWNRRVSLLLAMSSIAISIVLLLGVDSIRKEAKSAFLNTVSKTDLIVGARGGDMNLLLYSIFHIGDATNNVPYGVYRDIAAMKKVAWAVPISLGDSHRGFRVMGTNGDYFRYYRHGDGHALEFARGAPFADVYDAVVGFDVARALGYALEDKIILTHGIVATGHAAHDDKPFRLVGILKKTGTPVDRVVLVSLAGIEAIHVDWQSGTRSPLRVSAERARHMALEPKSITAFLLGLENRIDTFRVQRKINEYRNEPLTAVMPGVTLARLWQTLGRFEQVLMGVSALVLVAGLVGLLTTLLSTLNERRREMAVLRAVGAHAWHVVALFLLESTLVVTGGCLLGLALLYGGRYALQPIIAENYGLHLAIAPPDGWQILILAAAVTLGALLSLIPGVIAYRRALHDGLMVRV
ncbi:MAG: putative ABC transport system permease protein [Candidatus Kentron sp. G]|nr:MAG: putative ABC transport system permease protein [Candidatus Kentron sp. G]VFM98705.1 MAG: putative ABC transport system permease protein [Candidatus Kentron sp. G]VFN00832.1 MAG: putative ABC transport system permease protein [Candidatus Kentron sp. G]